MNLHRAFKLPNGLGGARVGAKNDCNACGVARGQKSSVLSSTEAAGDVPQVDFVLEKYV